MARELTTGVQAEVGAPLLRPAIFYEGEFSAGVLRLWTGCGEMTWNGHTWVGAGNLLGISEITETADVSAHGLTGSLSGIPSELIELVHNEARHGKPGKVWLGFLDGGGAIIADPYLAFSGRLDVPSIEDSGDTCTVTIQYESRLVDLLRPRVRRLTHEDQQIGAPGDRFFEFVASQQLQELEW